MGVTYIIAIVAAVVLLALNHDPRLRQEGLIYSFFLFCHT